MAVTYYYYFVTHLFGRVTIEKFITKMTLIGYEQLTDEQVEFYLANPTASVEEVRKCELNHPYIPPAPSIVQLQDDAKRQLKEAYLAKMSRYSDLQVVGAISSHYALTTLTISDNVPYSLSEAKNIIEGFNSLMKSAKAIYDRHKKNIEDAATKEVIASELEEAKEEMEVL